MNKQNNADFEKFILHSNPLELARPANGRQYCESVGRKAAILGFDSGKFEIWIYPFKIVQELQFSVHIPRYNKLVACSAIADLLINRPEMSTLVFSHEIFNIHLHLLTPLNEPGCLLLFDVSTDTDLEIWIQFMPELKPMWPAGIGGQYTSWLDEIHAYAISEGSRQFHGIIGSLLAEPYSETPGHQLPDEPMKFVISVNGKTAAKKILPVAVTASFNSRTEAIELYKNLFIKIPEFYEQNFQYYSHLRNDFCRIETDDREFDLAFEWAKVSLDKGFIENPYLGKGLVAGYEVSGNSLRPGFAWFFGGDTFINSFAISSYGDFEMIKEALTFFRDRQRDDGKIPHEIAQSATLIPWFEKYPYAFYHADTTAFFIIAMADYALKSGDVDFLEKSWESIFCAYKFCRNADEDEDGLMENSAAGLAAMEVGKLLPKTKIDIYLASVWLQAIKSMLKMCDLLNKDKLRKEIEHLYSHALRSFKEIFVNENTGVLNFSQLVSGEKISELTVWQAIPYLFDFIDDETTLEHISGSEMTTDWGVRSLSRDSRHYDPLNYNTGTVWPFTTGYVAGAQFRQHRFLNGWENLSANAALTFVEDAGWQSELYSGDFFCKLETAVTHQLFSASGILNPFFTGLLGLEINALENEIKFQPHFPFHWKKCKIENISCGGESFSVSMQKTHGKLKFKFHKKSGGILNFQFSPALPGRSRIAKVFVNQKTYFYEIHETKHDVHCLVKFDLQKESEIEIKYFAGLEILPSFPQLHHGMRSHQLRFIKYNCDTDFFLLEIEGRTGMIYELSFRTDYEIEKIEGAELVEKRAPQYKIRIDFEKNPENNYETKKVFFHLKNWQNRSRIVKFR